MNRIPYSIIRKEIKVGDIIGCQGGGFISRLIRKLKGGEWDLSHVATIIRDTHNELDGRVEVLEALADKKGMQRNYLSRIYEVDHGKLFWLQMNCTPEQREQIKELGEQIEQSKTKYDFRSTWLALFSPIFVDATKFNCSEASWYLLTRVGRLLMRFNKDQREIAPIPGDFPTWAGVEPIRIDMRR